MITTQTELDVSPGGIAPVIHVSQYDTGSRTLLFNLVATAGDLILPNGTKAEIRGTKPDGNGFSYDALINSKTVTVDVTEQMTAAAGKAVCELILYTGTPAKEGAEASADFTQLATANFILFIERAALDKDTVRSGSEIKQLITVLDRTDELLAAAQTMDDAKEQIAEMTESTRSDMTALANSVSETAAELAEQSAASARSASQSAQAAEKTLETVEAKGEQLSRLAITSDTLAKQALEKATNAENESAETSNAVDMVNRELARLRLLTEGKVDDAYSCTALVEVIVPKLSYVANNTFYGCTALRQLDLPSAQSLGGNVLQNASGMEVVNIGPRIQTINSTAFRNTPDGMIINLPIAEGVISGAPWGAPNAIINYEVPYAGTVPIPES